MFCLPTKLADKFIIALKEGKLDPSKLSDLTSADRRSYFESLIGKENAADVNALFESKLLLKNQQLGMINWARQVAGLKDPIRRDLITTIQKMDKVLTPKSERAFLEDLAAKKLGTAVTFEEASKIAELSRKVDEARQDTSTKEKLIDYGAQQIKLIDYVDSLKPSTQSKFVGSINIPRTLTTIGDWGWTFRQGWGMMSRPQLWQGLAKSFAYAAKDSSFQRLRAEVISDPDYQLLKGKLRLPALTDKLSGKEEEFMNQFTGRLPVLKQVERSQQGMATFVRFSVAKKMLRDARAAGEDIQKGSQAVTDIANSVNNFSGSGNLGTGDKYANVAPLLNASLFSARKISATVNMLDPRTYFDPRISPTARKASLRNLVGSAGITLSIVYLAKLAGMPINTDSTNSDFLNLRFGKFHIDLTGGNKTYAVLLSRLIQNQSTSSSGKVTKFGVGYKPQTRGSTLQDFGRNKLAPLAATVADWLLGPIPSHDPAVAKALLGDPAKGTPFDIRREALGNVTPMIVDLVIQAVKEDPSNAFLGALFDYFGNSAQIY
jgi:hypothetical protein